MWLINNRENMPAAKLGLTKVAVWCYANPDALGWLIIRLVGFQIKFCNKNHFSQVAK